MLANFFRNSLPWVYESGIDAYRKLKEGDSPEARKALEDFRRTAQASVHSPIAHEMMGRRGMEPLMMLEEALSTMDDFLPQGSSRRSRRTTKSDE